MEQRCGKALVLYARAFHGASFEQNVSEPGIRRCKPVIELEEQEMYDFRKLAVDNISSMPTSPIDATRRRVKTSAGAISVLEELFPQELGREHPRPRAERHVPRAPMDLPSQSRQPISMASGEDDLYPDLETIRGQGSKRRPFSLRRVTEIGTRQGPALVYLREASRNLTENDFRQIAPRGRHLEGWSGASSFTRIIRERDDTLQRTGGYVLFFADRHAAQSYCDNAGRLHQQSGVLSPRAIHTPVSRLMGADDRSISAWKGAMAQYTLAPSSHSLSMRVVDPPFGMLGGLVNQGGYPELVESRVSDFEVLLWLDGLGFPPLNLIKNALISDGKERGCFWTASALEQRGIRMLQDRILNNSAARSQERSGDIRDEAPKGALQRPRYFIVSFADEHEADRFVTGWHRRVITELVRDILPGSVRGEIVANAETI